MKKIVFPLLLILLFSFSTSADFNLPTSGILSITSNMGDPLYFEKEKMYIFYSQDFYLLDFPYTKRNDSENMNIKSMIFEKSSVERLVAALNVYRFEEYQGSVSESGGFLRIEYTNRRRATLYISDKTYLLFEEKNEKRAFVSLLDIQMARDLVSSLIYEGEKTTILYTKLTYDDSERKAFTRFNNGIKTVKVWTSRFEGKEVVSVIWQPCGCTHDPSDPNYARFIRSYLYFYILDGEIMGKEILKTNKVVGEDERDSNLLEKDYLVHNKPTTTPPPTTSPPTETPSPTPVTQPPTTPPQTIPPTPTPTIPPSVQPMSERTMPFLLGLVFGGIAFAISFFAGNMRRNRKTFK